jgi:hypothetical protein
MQCRIVKRQHQVRLLWAHRNRPLLLQRADILAAHTTITSPANRAVPPADPTEASVTINTARRQIVGRRTPTRSDKMPPSILPMTPPMPNAKSRKGIRFAGKRCPSNAAM